MIARFLPLCLPLLATAQLLPPDAVDLARVRIPESIEREGFCPVTLTRPGGDRPLFRALGITWRAATDAAQARFLAGPEEFIAPAEERRWQENFLIAMSEVWCPVTDQVNPGGHAAFRADGLSWRVCCRFCNPALVPECFRLARERLERRARESHRLTGGAYAMPDSSPVEAALDLGGRKIPSIQAATIEGGVIAGLGSAPVEDARFDRAFGEWRHYGGDRAHTRYSSLDQIRAETIGRLETAWTWESVDREVTRAVPGLRPGPFKPTPLMVGGVLYTSTCFSMVAAIDAGSGETIWVHDPRSYLRGRPANSGFQHRGVEYWTDGNIHRILIATGGAQLLSLDALTGRPDPAFGEDGVVDLSKGLGRPFDRSQLGFNSPPVVCRDTVVVGSVVFDYPSHPTTPPGHVRGYDVRTGERRWIFRTIPREGDFGNETWEEDSWRTMGNVNVWSTMSADEELGHVYLPVGTPTNDYYGGHRPGDNLFADSLVCLDAETGRRVWHFQAVHHGLWDYDLCSGPNLVDIRREGRIIPAVAQVSKQGFTYVFDRRTGKPVWPIEERPVPASDVPGERSSPTQPFPTRPPPFERQTLHPEDIIDFTPELHAEALRILEDYRHGPMFLPPSVPGTGGKKGSLVLPNAGGGANWSGAAVDPRSGTLLVPSVTRPLLFNLRRTVGGESGFRYNIRYGSVEGPRGLPLTRPPYSRITAIDLNRGTFRWQVPHGDGPRHHPAIRHLDTGPLGYAGSRFYQRGGGILTGGLFIVIQYRDPTHGAAPERRGGLIYAYDQETGAVVWRHELEDVYPLGTPMTYLHRGRQFLVLSVGTADGRGRLLALALADRTVSPAPPR